MTIEGEVIQEVKRVTPSRGSAGLLTQLYGQATTADGIAAASGGIDSGNLIEQGLEKPH